MVESLSAFLLQSTFLQASRLTWIFYLTYFPLSQNIVKSFFVSFAIAGCYCIYFAVRSSCSANIGANERIYAITIERVNS